MLQLSVHSLSLSNFTFKMRNDCPPTKVEGSLDLKKASQEGDVLANRKLFEVGEKCILHSYAFIPSDTSPHARLKMIFEAIIGGDIHAIKLLKKQARLGQIWAIYGIERLADAGLEKGKRVLDQIILLKRVMEERLWRSPGFASVLECYLDQERMLLPKELVLLSLLSTEVRSDLEHEFQNSHDGQENSATYFAVFLDYVFQTFEGFFKAPEELNGCFIQKVTKALDAFILSPRSLRFQLSVALFVDKMRSGLNIEEDSPLGEWASEILQRKRDLL